MNLAEALIKVNDIEKEIELLKKKYDNCALVPFNTTPLYNPDDLISQIEQKLVEKNTLIQIINITNKHNRINDLIIKRDQARRKYRILNICYRKAFRLEIFNNEYYRVYKEIDALRNKMHKLLEDYRKYDIMIQKLNWSIEL